MSETLLPVKVYEATGVSDEVALWLEVEALATVTQQLATERELADQVHRARSVAIHTSAAMRLVYEVDEPETRLQKPKTAMDDLLSSAFFRTVSSLGLPPGFATAINRDLRVSVHPDVGGDIEIATQVAKNLEEARADPAFSIATALLAARTERKTNAQSLRDERYKLAVARGGLSPIFGSVEEAKAHADKEVEGAEWRVRATAAFMTFDLLIGSPETWQSFLQGIVRAEKWTLITIVNRVQPEILALRERIAKGDPIKAEDLDATAVDSVLERIWSTINKKDPLYQYQPPYQNWLEVLLPAMRLLDPGQKPGEKYTNFRPPIQIQRAPQEYPNYGDSKYNTQESPYSSNNKLIRQEYYNKHTNNKY